MMGDESVAMGMNPLMFVVGALGICVCLVATRALVLDFRAKDVTFSTVSIVLRSHTYAGLVLLPMIGVIVFLCREFDVPYSAQPSVSVADLCISFVFVWGVCALVFQCLLLSRAFDRSIRKRQEAASVPSPQS